MMGSYGSVYPELQWFAMQMLSLKGIGVSLKGYVRF